LIPHFVRASFSHVWWQPGRQLHTLGLLEQLRAESKELWRTSSGLYQRVHALLREPANPNLHDIANMAYRVELWDRDAQHIRWTVAAVGHVRIAQATFEAAVREWSHERFTLRHGIRLISEHGPSEKRASAND
jgi:hypothetical protein